MIIQMHLGNLRCLADDSHGIQTRDVKRELQTINAHKEFIRFIVLMGQIKNVGSHILIRPVIVLHEVRVMIISRVPAGLESSLVLVFP